MRKSRSCLLVSCCLLILGAPAAEAKPVKARSSASLASALGRLGGAIKGLQVGLKNVEDVNLGQTDSIHRVDLRVDTVVGQLAGILAAAPQLADGMAGLKSGLTAVASGLAAARDGMGTLQANVASLGASVTSLGTTVSSLNGTVAGLSADRPKGALVEWNGTLIRGSAGVTTSKLGTGSYLVDFGTDISNRIVNVTVTPGAGLAAGVATVCTDRPGYCPTDSPDKAIVETYVPAPDVTTVSGTPVVGGPGVQNARDARFSVTAIAP